MPRLGRCPGWSESSLGAHAILLVLPWGSSSALQPSSRARSDLLSAASSSSLYCGSEQLRLWLDCTDAQACLSLCCLQLIYSCDTVKQMRWVFDLFLWHTEKLMRWILIYSCDRETDEVGIWFTPATQRNRRGGYLFYSCDTEKQMRWVSVLFLWHRETDEVGIWFIPVTQRNWRGGYWFIPVTEKQMRWVFVLFLWHRETDEVGIWFIPVTQRNWRGGYWFIPVTQIRWVFDLFLWHRETDEVGICFIPVTQRNRWGGYLIYSCDTEKQMRWVFDLFLWHRETDEVGIWFIPVTQTDKVGIASVRF